MTVRDGVGPIVVLNGAPRAGKSSIAAALRSGTPERWVALGVDRAMATTPPDLLPGIGLRPGGERPDLEVHLPRLYGALFDEVVTESRAGRSVVVDVGLHDDHSRPLGILSSAAGRLADLPAWFVGVRCPLDEVVRRRAATGFPTDPALAARWDDAVHRPGTYDLEVDTSILGPADAATLIATLVDGGRPPTALRRLRGGGGGP